MTWNDQYTTEIQRARHARAEGKEGMARVCARRAAGEVIREYFRRTRVSLEKPSALHALKTLAQTEGVSPRIREIATHFIWQITPDHTLPDDVDLLAEVGWLADELLR